MLSARARIVDLDTHIVSVGGTIRTSRTGWEGGKYPLTVTQPPIGGPRQIKALRAFRPVTGKVGSRIAAESASPKIQKFCVVIATEC